MNDFEYDCAQKKRIARSAKNHVNARRGKCKLPHEYLTAKERKALNGEVKTYNIRVPLDKHQFLTLPTDLAKDYLLWLQSEFRATDGQIAEMFGCSAASVNLYRKTLDVPSLGRGNQNRRNKEQMKKWDAFVHPEVTVAKNETVEVTTEVTTEVITPEPLIARTIRLSVSWENVHSWEELYSLCKQMPFPDYPAAVMVGVN